MDFFTNQLPSGASYCLLALKATEEDATEDKKEATASPAAAEESHLCCSSGSFIRIRCCFHISLIKHSNSSSSNLAKVAVTNLIGPLQSIACQVLPPLSKDFQLALYQTDRWEKDSVPCRVPAWNCLTKKHLRRSKYSSYYTAQTINGFKRNENTLFIRHVCFINAPLYLPYHCYPCHKVLHYSLQ